MKPFSVKTKKISVVFFINLHAPCEMCDIHRPAEHIEDWLNTCIGIDRWSYHYDANQLTSCFAFDNEEDLLVFNLTWLANDQDMFWHPV